MTTSHLRPDDVDRMLGLLDDARRDEPGPAVPWALLEGLASLVGGDVEVSYQVLDLPGRRFHTAQGLLGDVREFVGPEQPEPPELDEEVERFFTLTWDDPLCSYHLRSGDLTRVLLLSDFFPTDRDVRNRPMIRDLNPGMRTLLEIALPAPPGLSRRILLARDEDPPFGERERQIATLLRPHLQEIVLEAHRRRGTVPRLTPREREVLTLTAAGLSHAEIAARLFVSVSTVRKHMEHVRGRLGVHSATAAAALVMPHGATDPVSGRA